MFVVRDGDVGGIEERIFNAINGLPDWLKAPMWVFQIFGSLATASRMPGCSLPGTPVLERLLPRVRLVFVLTAGDQIDHVPTLRTLARWSDEQQQAG